MGKRVFSVLVGNPENCNFAELDLPATPWELVDAMDKLRLSEEQQPYWRLEDAGRYHFLVSHLDDWDFYKVNALAEQLSTFSDVNAVAFEGLVKMAVDRLCKINGGVLTLQRVLDMAYSADRCHVVPGIKDDEALGHFCVENDFLPELENIPEDVLRMLDYARIGKAMREREDGVITPYGYVAQSGALRQAPPNLGRHARKPPYMIRFFCINATRVLQLHLPTTQAKLDATLECLDANSWREVRLEDPDSAIPDMCELADIAYDDMEQINRFAECLADIEEAGELVKFKAAIQQLCITNLEDATTLADHLDEYVLEPGICSFKQLAQDELCALLDERECGLLQQYLNMDAYGAELMQRNNGAIGSYGYLARLDGQPMHLPQQGADMTMQ